MKVSMSFRIAATVLLMVAIISAASGAPRTRSFSLKQAMENKDIKVELFSKQGGFLGDTTSVKITNNVPEKVPIKVSARKGEFLQNKNTNNQNLVVLKVVKTLKPMEIPHGETNEAPGLWTACVDMHKGRPSSDDVFDLTSNIGDMDNVAAQKLLRLLDVIDQKGLHESWTAQYAIWKVTDNRVATEPDVRELLEEAGIDPDEDITDFPHPVTPYSHESESRSVSLEEIGISELGVGDVTVTLTWHNMADLDLRVIWLGPDGEFETGDDEIVDWEHPVVSSGGQLSKDANKNCENLTNTPIERIFWPTGQAPLGEFWVEVEYFKECLNEGETQWQVRTLVDGQEEVLEGVISPEDKIIFATVFTR